MRLGKVSPVVHNFTIPYNMVTETCSVASNAENRDPWDLPHVITIAGMLSVFVFACRLYFEIVLCNFACRLL